MMTRTSITVLVVWIGANLVYFIFVLVFGLFRYWFLFVQIWSIWLFWGMDSTNIRFRLAKKIIKKRKQKLIDIKEQRTKKEMVWF